VSSRSIPAIFSFLSRQAGKIHIPGLRIFLGIVAGGGILISMLLFGLIVVSILSLPLSGALGFISPVAYSILLILGILLVLGWVPVFTLPSPILSAEKNPISWCLSLWSLFRGSGTSLQCCPGCSTARPKQEHPDIFTNMVNFILFGAGMAVPVILLSALSSLKGNEVTGFLTDHKRTIDVITGILMIAVAGYYLFTIVRIQDWV